jgi:hypothetical protein
MPSKTEQLRRKSLLRHALRDVQEDAMASLEEVAASYVGRTYEDLLPLMEKPLYPKVQRGDPTYSIIVSAHPASAGDDLILNFQVDDGDLGMIAPTARWNVVKRGESFTGLD